MELSQETLCLIWFFIMGVLLTGYAMLDGFDLGVGILHPFVPRSDEERRLSMNSIGPIWDGNEVWLVVFGGALFAMFPEVYASAFSGFYSAFMLLLVALIFRAVSFDFRSKVQSPWWRHFWDYAFSGGSLLSTVLFGIAVGNLIAGIPLSERGDFLLGLSGQLRPFALMVGVLAVALFALHGSIFLYLKTEGELQERAHRMIWRCFGFFMIAYIFTTIWALVEFPHVIRNFRIAPVLWIVPVVNVLALANVPRAVFKGQPGYAFLSSCVCIASLIALLGIALFPYMIIDVSHIERSITLYTGASSSRTLGLGLLFVVFGMPFVLAYSVVVYWTFRGKVKLDRTSY